MFENWLRFYFIIEEDENLRLRLPEQTRARIQELYPDLAPLADALNEQTIDFDISRNSVLRYILDYMDGKSIPRGEAQRILQSATFQARLQLFHTWTQLHEEQLDNAFMEFGAWRSLFSQWLETPGAKELEKKLMRPKTD